MLLCKPKRRLMMANNYRQRMAILAKNKEKIKTVIDNKFEYCFNSAGIYVLTREQDGFRYAYVGQTQQPIINRLAEHLSGYSQHIDVSLKKHKLYSENNPSGWKVVYIEPCSNESLDRMEQFWIKHYADLGFQLRNKTSGSQGQGKFGIAENKSSKGYYDGIEHGKKKMLELIQKLEQQRHQVKKDGSPSAIAIKAQEEWERIVKGENV